MTRCLLAYHGEILLAKYEAEIQFMSSIVLTSGVHSDTCSPIFWYYHNIPLHIVLMPYNYWTKALLMPSISCTSALNYNLKCPQLQPQMPSITTSNAA